MSAMTNPPAEPGAMPEVLRDALTEYVTHLRQVADSEERVVKEEMTDSTKTAWMENVDHYRCQANDIETALTQHETQLAHLRAEGAKDRKRLDWVIGQTYGDGLLCDGADVLELACDEFPVKDGRSPSAREWDDAVNRLARDQIDKALAHNDAIKADAARQTAEPA